MADDTNYIEFYDNVNKAESGSPEQLAEQLFRKKPGDSCTLCILPYSENQDNDAASFNFEILLTIYLEGLMNIFDVIKQNYISQSLKDTSKTRDDELEYKLFKNHITIDDLKFPDPWFKSFGYTINITEYGPENEREFNKKIKPLSYCRVLFSFDRKDKIQFLMKGISKKYTFILNGSYKPINDLEKIYATLSKGDQKFYKVSFKPYRLAATIKDKCGFNNLNQQSTIVYDQQ